MGRLLTTLEASYAMNCSHVSVQIPFLNRTVVAALNFTNEHVLEDINQFL